MRSTAALIILAMTAIIISAIFAIAFYFHPLYAGVFAATLAAIAVVLRAIAGDRDDSGHDAKNQISDLTDTMTDENYADDLADATIDGIATAESTPADDAQ
jgi:hypothetical protein